jgi:hypothetical protein
MSGAFDLEKFECVSITPEGLQAVRLHGEPHHPDEDNARTENTNA